METGFFWPEKPDAGPRVPFQRRFLRNRKGQRVSTDGILKGRYCYYKKKGQRYRILLQSAGEDVATVYYQSKLRFKPANYRELLRVKETDKMARDVCFDRFKEWSIGLKLKLLVPHFLAFLSNRRKYK